MTVELRDYQRVAVDFLRGRRRAGLFLDMGLGKTASTLVALGTDRLPALVVAPKRVAELTWPHEIKKFRPDLTFEVAAGSAAHREEVLSRSRADVVIIGRDNIADAVAYSSRWRTLVLDELSGFKDRSTARWKAAKKLAKNKTDVWGLTGTPTPNGLLDLWAQLYLLDGGKALGSAKTAFQHRFFEPEKKLPSGIVTKWRLQPGADALIYRAIEDVCLSMSTEGRVELPELVHNEVVVPMSPKTRKLYRGMKNDMVGDLADFGIPTSAITAPTAAVLSMKLRQVCSGVLYGDSFAGEAVETHRLHKAKVDAVRGIADETGSPLLVFYAFTAEKDLYLEAFPGAITVDTPGWLDKWNSGEVPMLLAHPRQIQYGLNLQDGGHVVVWASLTWSSEDFQQANKRLHRSGQKNAVIVHRLVTEGSLEPGMYDVLEGKRSVEKALLEHLYSPI